MGVRIAIDDNIVRFVSVGMSHCRKIGMTIILVAMATAIPRMAGAVPAFAQQTGQPCATCHVGAFGPQLRPYGRDFKLRGYTASEGKEWRAPLTMTMQTSFTHTKAAQPGGASRWFAPNDNVALDQVSLYYAGRVTPKLGAFIETNYDGIARTLSFNNVDIRYADEFSLLGIEGVAGLTLTNSPTVSDLWNSSPAWGFPYNSSGLAPGPVATAMIDGQLGQRLVGPGAYALWGDWIYTEFALYRGLGRDLLNATGIVPASGAPRIEGVVPYWRLAVQHDYDSGHSFEIGSYGLHASIFPNGDRSAGATDNYTDLAFDANYQFIVNPDYTVSDMISAHATLIHEKQDLNASNILSGSNRHNTLNTFRADISYSFNATVTPSIQYFNTWGSADANFYSSPNGPTVFRPNSAGVIAEVAYVPFGKPDSMISWGNIRFAVQYVAYTQFNGMTHGANDNNAVFLSVWLATHF